MTTPDKKFLSAFDKEMAKRLGLTEDEFRAKYAPTDDSRSSDWKIMYANGTEVIFRGVRLEIMNAASIQVRDAADQLIHAYILRGGEGVQRIGDEPEVTMPWQPRNAERCVKCGGFRQAHPTTECTTWEGLFDETSPLVVRKNRPRPDSPITPDEL